MTAEKRRKEHGRGEERRGSGEIRWNNRCTYLNNVDGHAVPYDEGCEVADVR